MLANEILGTWMEINAESAKVQPVCYAQTNKRDAQGGRQTIWPKGTQKNVWILEFRALHSSSLLPTD